MISTFEHQSYWFPPTQSSFAPSSFFLCTVNLGMPNIKHSSTKKRKPKKLEDDETPPTSPLSEDKFLHSRNKRVCFSPCTILII